MADCAGLVDFIVSEFIPIHSRVQNSLILRSVWARQAIAGVMTLVTEVGFRDDIYYKVGGSSFLLAGGAELMAGDTIAKKGSCLYFGGNMDHLGCHLRA